MVTREDLELTRDELLARKEALLERAQEIREQFRDNVDTDTVAMVAGLSLMSGGLAWGLTLVTRGRRGVFALLPSVALFVAGLYLAGRGAMSRRGMHIMAAEAEVRQQLAGLDPLARVRVLKDMASEQVAFVRRAD